MDEDEISRGLADSNPKRMRGGEEEEEDDAGVASPPSQLPVIFSPGDLSKDQLPAIFSPGDLSEGEDKTFERVAGDFAIGCKRSIFPAGWHVYNYFANGYQFMTSKELESAYSFMGYDEYDEKAQEMRTRSFIKKWCCHTFQLDKEVTPIIPKKGEELHYLTKANPFSPFQPYSGIGWFPSSGPAYEVPDRSGIMGGKKDLRNFSFPQFNLATPYEAEFYMPSKVKNPQVITDFLRLIRALSGDKTPVEDPEDKHFRALLVSTAAIFQRAHEQQPATVFQGDKRIGKGTYVTIMAHIAGDNKLEETANPKRDLGNFNAILGTAQIIAINEVKKDDLDFEQLKNMITDKRKRVGDKNVKVQTIHKFVKLIFSCNKTSTPLFSDADGAYRAVQFLCSSSLGPNATGDDAKVLGRLYKYLENPEYIRDMFDFLMLPEHLVGYDFTKVARTDFQEEAALEEGETPVLLFLRFVASSVEQNGNGGVFKVVDGIYSRDQTNLYIDFGSFCASQKPNPLSQGEVETKQLLWRRIETFPKIVLSGALIKNTNVRRQGKQGSFFDINVAKLEALVGRE